MLRFTAHITDDRGRRVPVFNPHNRETAVPVWHDEQLSIIVRHLAEKISPGSDQPLNRSHLLLFIPGFVVPVVLAIAPWAGLPRWVQYMVAFGLFLAISPWLWRVYMATQAAPIVATLLGQGRCPSCTYPIHQIADQPDGCVVCPECGGAWSRARVATPIAAPSSAAGASIPGRGRAHRFAPRPAVTDARQHIRELIDPTLRALDPQRRNQLGEDRLARARHAVRRAIRKPVWIVLTLGGLLTGLFLTVFLLASLAPPPGAAGSVRIWRPLLPVVIVAFVSFLVWRLLTYRIRTTALPAARALINENLCPACAGDLAPDSASNDLRLCSSCGAAWKSDGP